jgi:hypothetical protein
VLRSSVLELLVLAESNLGYNPRTSFEQCYFLAQRQEQSNTIEEVPVQLLIDYIKQIVLHRK